MKRQGIVGRKEPVSLKSFATRLMGATALMLIIGTLNTNAQYPINVQTITSLRAINTTSFTNQTVAYVMDYYGLSALGQHGGGHFIWITPISSIPTCCGGVAADDGGKYIASSYDTNGLWVRMFDGATPNVKMWGAVGDGSHDDTTNIQNAINGIYGLGLSPNTGELIFPSGNYLVSTTIVFNASFAHIRGDGPMSTTVTMQYGSSADIFRTGNASSALTGGGGGYDHGLLFEDIGLAFATSGTNIPPARDTTHSALVLGEPGEVSTIRNVITSNGGIGIRCLGAGATGLRLEDVKCQEAAIAGVSVESYPGQTGESGGPINIIGLSGDQIYGDVASNSCLVLISNVYIPISIESIKAESDYGGGLIHYLCPGDGVIQGFLSLRNCRYNAGYTVDGKFFQPDFVKIDGPTNGGGAVISIEQVNLNAVHNLIRDNVCGRIVEADVQTVTGYNQLTARLPLTYVVSPTGSGSQTQYLEATGSALFVGETAITTFYATNTGWYRIMAPYGTGMGSMAGRISITSPFASESIELQADCTDWNTPWLNVTRCKTGVHVVSQARAISYWDPVRSGPWSFVDIYVSNAIPAMYGIGARLTVTLDTQGVQSFDGYQTQLLSPIIPVGAPPAGASVTTVNTYR